MCNSYLRITSWIPDPWALVKTWFWILVSHVTLDGVRTYCQNLVNSLVYPYISTSQTNLMDSEDQEGRIDASSCQKCNQRIKNLEEAVNVYAVLYKSAKDENKSLIRRSEQLTLFMAKNAHGMTGLENLNDPFSNTKLAERFERIFLDSWAEVLMHEQQRTELESIKRLSLLMKDAHDMCVSLARDKIRDFAFLQKDDRLPKRSDHPDLYKELAIFGRTDAARKTVQQEISNVLWQRINETAESKIQPLKHFLDEFVDCCWLMLVSVKPFVFTFNVVNKVLKGDLERKFAVYCSMIDLKTYGPKQNGTIVELVWPEIDDNDGTQKKGKVLVIDNDDTDSDGTEENEEEHDKDKGNDRGTVGHCPKVQTINRGDSEG